MGSEKQPLLPQVLNLNERPASRRKSVIRGDTADFEGDNLCLHDLALRWAKDDDRTCIIDGDRELNYSWLKNQVDSSVRTLREAGVPAGSYVALLVERGIQQLIAIYAVLSVGAAYIPMDPSHPPARFQDILEVSAASALIVQEDLAVPAAATACAVLRISPSGVLRIQKKTRHGDALRGPGCCSTPTKTEGPSFTGADSDCYVTFTSGTTGKPKGVRVAHRSVVMRMMAYQMLMPLNGSDRLLYKTPYTFGVSEWEIFWPFMVGSTVVVLPEGDHKDAQKLSDAILAQNITHVFFVTSMLKALCAMGRDFSGSLKHVIQCGEKLDWLCVDAVQTTLQHRVQLHNVYGATESATTCWTSPPPSWLGWRNDDRGVPAGKPHANTTVFILDPESGQLVEEGETGVVHFAGCIAEGYLKMPQLTAEKFVTVTLDDGTTVRSYNTGDLGKILPDKQLEVLGRADKQVKVRGYRIELWEVEGALVKAAGGQAKAAAVVTDHEGAEKKIVGFVANADGDTAAIRETMKTLVPSYMVPSKIIKLEDFPKLSSGKVDMKSLATQATAAVENSEEDDLTPNMKEAATKYSSVAEFLKSEQYQQMRESEGADPGVDSLGLTKLFTESPEEIKLRDNLYAIAICMVIVYHMTTDLAYSRGTSFLHLLLTSEDCMTVWVLLSGYQEGRKRRAGPGWGGKAVAVGAADAAAFLLWVLMRYIVPILLMPIWWLTKYPTGFKPLYWYYLFHNRELHGQFGNEWSPPVVPSLSEFSNELVGPWMPSWYMLWVVVAKIHAVVLDRLRIHPILQIIICLALGFLTSFIPKMTIPGVEIIPVLGPIFGKGFHFWNVMWMSYTAMYIWSIHYVQPLLIRSIQLGKSTVNMFLASVVFLSIMVITHYGLNGPVSITVADNGWWSLKFLQESGTFVEFWSDHGFQYIWTLLAWPVVAICKIVMLAGAPFHLKAIGRTSYGSYMIHPYMPVIFGWYVKTHVVSATGESAEPFVRYLVFILEALLIQYTVGRLADWLSIGAVSRVLQVFTKGCGWLRRCNIYI